MPTNEQRREAAKRKLERQLERRAQRARKRKQLTIAGSVLAVVLVVGAIALVYVLTKGDKGDDTNSASTWTTGAGAEATDAAELPDPTAKPDTVNCTYTPTQEPAAKPVQPPKTDGIATTGDNAKVGMSIETSQGNIGLTLDNAHAPCTVNNFVSLASQGFFDGTPCHRLTTAATLKVLQCGDPTGSGTGSPGYGFANEYPTDQYAKDDPALQFPAGYKRGVIAMAHSQIPDSNGSQFFLVYGDSQLPPDYTIFGTIDDTGLQTLDKVAAAGLEGGSTTGDGKPALPVQLNSVRLD